MPCKTYGNKHKKEIIQESFRTKQCEHGKTENSNTINGLGETSAPIRALVQKTPEILELDPKEYEEGNTKSDSTFRTSSNSKRRIQGERLAKRSKKYYKDIREYAKIFKINDKTQEYDRNDKRYYKDENKGNVKVTKPTNIPEYKELHETKQKEKEQVEKKRTQRGTHCETVAELEAINENDNRKDTGYDKEKQNNNKKKKYRKKP